MVWGKIPPLINIIPFEVKNYAILNDFSRLNDSPDV